MEMDNEITTSKYSSPFQDPQFVDAYNSQVIAVLKDPNFISVVRGMAEENVNTTLIGDCSASNMAVVRSRKVKNMRLKRDYSGGYVYSESDLETEKKLWKIATVMAIIALTVFSVLGYVVFTGKTLDVRNALTPSVAASESNNDIGTVSGAGVPVEALGGSTGPIENRVTPAKAAFAYNTYMDTHNPTLKRCAAAVVSHPRWVEAVSILKIETQTCKVGYGLAPSNNCGNVMSSKTGRKWKMYASPCDSIEDVAILLSKPRYATKTIAEANGIYCQDNGGPCEGWTESTMKEVEEIRKLLTD